MELSRRLVPGNSKLGSMNMGSISPKFRNSSDGPPSVARNDNMNMVVAPSNIKSHNYER